MKNHTAMIKTLVISSMLCAWTLMAFPQTSVKVIVVDAQTKTPVKFALLSYTQVNQRIGVYSDALGVVSTDLPAAVDSISISCLGYQTVTLSQIASDTIALRRKAFDQSGVIVRPDNSNLFTTLGYINKKRSCHISASSGSECAVLIENETGIASPIKSVLFKIKQSDKYKTAIRIHLYTCDSHRMPDKELINDNLVEFITPQNDGMIEYDISKLGITMPLNGIFVGLELVGCIDGESGQIIQSNRVLETSIELTTLYQQATFIRNIIDNKRWDNSSLNNIMPLKKGTYLNAAFGLKVFEL